MADSLLRPGSTQEQDQIYVFGACEFDESRLELRVQGRLADLELKPMEVLRVLLQRGDQVSSKEELLKAVWPGLSVVDGSLATAVSKLRKALGDEDSSLVRTVQRVGYRLGVPVECRTIVGRASAAAAPNTFPLQQGAAVPGRESWKLLRALDTTASTEVWLAENPKTREQRVFKFANSDGRLRSLKREVTVSRFLRETLGEPPHFVRIFEWNFERAPYYLESEYGGQNLAEWAATGSQLSGCSLGVRLQLITAVARAVADAHAAGVIHQDLKPTNILIAPAAGGGWNVKVSDFGSASLIEPKRLAQMGITNLGYTRTAETVSSLSGTLLYMAPEVLSGNPPTAASDVYALGVMLYQIVVGDFRRPLSPGWESQIDDPLLREDIAEAAFGDPARRVKSAAEFADRLASIDVRKRERDVRDEQRRLQLAEEQHRREMRARRPWMLAAAAALLLAVLVAIFAVRRTNSMTPAQGGAVAILPFQNSAADPSLNFLSLAIPNELETQLSYSQSLPIRPFALTSHFTQSNPDLHKIGQDLKVSRAVTGMYLRNGQNLAITLEAIDLVTNQVLWRRTLNVPQNDFRSMQGQLAGVARTELAQSLGAKGITTDIAAHPASAEAYDGYLRSLAIAYEPSAVNRQGVALLEDSVRGDPNYAPAWQELGRREYSEFRYANGGPAAEQRWVDALNQVLRIDPGNAQAMTSLVVRQVEKGQLAPALAQARELVRRRPDTAGAPVARGAALRYAGLLDEAARECETGFAIDPYGFRSCSVVYLQRGNPARAIDYIQIHEGSDWANAMMIHTLVREGKLDAAAKIPPPHIPGWESFNLLQACASHAPPSQISVLAAAVQPSDDPETNYFAASHLAYCGQKSAALQMLHHAIEGKYCSYPALDTDPFFDPIRPEPEFASARSAGMACQHDVLSEH